VGFKEAAQGMAADRMAAGFEAAARLEGIELTVEFVAERAGHPASQHTGGLVAFGASSGHSALHVLVVISM
jgi:hypothetical protein